MKFSISFILIILLLGLMIGDATGSILHQVFGLEFLNYPIGPYQVVKDFYVIKRLDIQLTPAGLIGLGVTIFVLYKKGRA